MTENTDVNIISKGDSKTILTKTSDEIKSYGVLHGDECDYELISELGTGSYGEVFKAKCVYHNSNENSEDVEYCAIKRYKSSHSPESYGIAATTLRELQVLQTLCHINIIKVKDIILQKSEQQDDKKYKDVFAVFNLCDTDLRRHIYKLEGIRRRQQNSGKTLKIDKPFHPYSTTDYITHVKDAVFQILMGLAHCHSRRIIHRDLKPANIFLTSILGGKVNLDKFCVKIGDFGLARAARLPIPPLTRDIATLWYRPPEILLGSTSYCTSVDIWSTGCIFAEMLKVSPLFFGECELETLLQIFKILGTPNSKELKSLTALEYFLEDFPKWKVDPVSSLTTACRGLDSKGVDLLVRMLCLEPSARITAREALLHPWFESLNKSEYTFWSDSVPDWALQKTVKRFRPQKNKPATRKSLRIVQKLNNDPTLKVEHKKMKKKATSIS